ncbi:MAG: 6-phosphofructokinase [Velocimicrobium sp.]
MNQRNCMIGQSGGPTAAINASLAGVISKAMETHSFEHIYGTINGIEGLLKSRYLELTNIFKSADLLLKLLHTPAMYLGSCRYKLPQIPSNATQTTVITEYEVIFSTFKKLAITDFFYIGGNDSMDTVMKLSRYALLHNSSIHFIGIPKTIDNDLYGTDHTPGFGSAAKFVATSMLEIIHDSMIYTTKSVTIVEVMGRNAGWLTAATALSRTSYGASPDLIYLPEVIFDIPNFLHSIKSLFEKRKNIIIAVSEGIHDKNGNFIDDSNFCHETTATFAPKKDVFGHVIHNGTGKALEHIVANAFGCKTRSIELNVLQRCSMHIASKTDLDESFHVGEAAVSSALENESAIMITMERLTTSDCPYKIKTATREIESIANIERRVPLEWISKEGNDITKEFYDYLYPLIQGEATIKYNNGIPDYMDISHLF